MTGKARRGVRPTPLLLLPLLLIATPASADLVPGGNMCIHDEPCWTPYGTTTSPIFGNGAEACGADQGAPNPGCQVKFETNSAIGAIEGIYQQLAYTVYDVTVGQSLLVRGQVLAWPAGAMRLGLDADGGTNPAAAEVVWSTDDTTCDDGYQWLAVSVERTDIAWVQCTLFIEHEVIAGPSTTAGFCCEVQAEQGPSATPTSTATPERKGLAASWWQAYE